uniref:Uncharacterized protein n=1 Tax=Sphaerodactylus townsendi TaxID=933632 RepID=A0ACB8EAK3_9SAUR
MLDSTLPPRHMTRFSLFLKNEVSQGVSWHCGIQGHSLMALLGTTLHWLSRMIAKKSICMDFVHLLQILLSNRHLDRCAEVERRLNEEMQKYIDLDGKRVYSSTVHLE